jgi:hypothetical protein
VGAGSSAGLSVSEALQADAAKAGNSDATDTVRQAGKSKSRIEVEGSNSLYC